MAVTKRIYELVETLNFELGHVMIDDPSYGEAKKIPLNFVSLSGDQTIGGNKTFTGIVTIQELHVLGDAAVDGTLTANILEVTGTLIVDTLNANTVNAYELNAGGPVTFDDLSGVDNRWVVAEPDGHLITNPILIFYKPETDTYKLADTLDGQTQDLGQEIFQNCVDPLLPVLDPAVPVVYLVVQASAAYPQFSEVILPVAGDIAIGAPYGLNTTVPDPVTGKFKMTTYGLVNGVDTSGWAANTVLYVDPAVPGGMTSIEPLVDVRVIGFVTEQDAVTGKIFVISIYTVGDVGSIVPGVFEQTWLTGVPDGAFYAALREDKGNVPQLILTQTVNDNETLPLPSDHLTPAAPIESVIDKGTYEGQLEVIVNNEQAAERMYMEIYLADGAGVPVDSGILTQPVGDLGVRPMTVLASSLLNMASGTTNFIPLVGFLAESVVMPAGYRNRAHILVEKVGTQGANKTFDVYFGYEHLSYVRVPVLLRLGDLADVDVTGAVATNVIKLDVSGLWTDAAVQAIEVAYNNAVSLMAAINVQEAIDELDAITDRLNINWRGNWSSGSYIRQDMVKDGDWTMWANKDTSDRPAPQPQGNQFYIYAGIDPTNNDTAKQIVFGNRYTFDQGGYINGYRIYVVTGNQYSVFTVTDPLGTPIVEEIFEFTAVQSGWREISITPVIVGVGTVFDLVAVTTEPNPTPTTFNGNWDYFTPNNPAPPDSGEILHANNALSILRVSKTDSDVVDRSVDLATLTVGDIINGPGDMRWAIQTITDQGTWYDYAVAPAQQGSPDGIFDFVFETVTSTPITYLEDIDYWLTSAYNVEGLLGVDIPYVDIVPNNSAYGTDILVQEAYISPDWDVVALSGGGGGEGGGEGGADTFTEDIVVSIDPDKSFGRYADGDTIPALGLTAREVILLALNEPLPPTLTLTSSGDDVVFGEGSKRVYLDFTYVINSAGASVDTVLLEYQRGTGGWNTLSTDTGITEYLHNISDAGNRFNTDIMYYRYTVVDTAGGTATINYQVQPEEYAVPTLILAITGTTPSPESAYLREKGNTDSTVNGSLASNRSLCNFTSYTVRRRVDGGSWTTLYSSGAILNLGETIIPFDDTTVPITATTVDYQITYIDQYTTGTGGDQTVVFNDYSYFGYDSLAVLNSAEIIALGNELFATSQVRTEDPVTAPAPDYTYYCYPAEYADITSIILDGVTPILGAFTKLSNVTVTNSHGVAKSYKVYKSNAPGAFTGNKVEFS